ncbi:isoaspartyl peptidase/L-asparaginase-like [Acropora palmata]
MSEPTSPSKPCIIVHGGAGSISSSRSDLEVLCVLKAVKEAAQIGYQVLLAGGSSLDAVEEATRSMESSGVLNAGCGSYLTEDGTVECGAMIMDGSTLSTGSVACVKNIANPISLARKVMTKTPHCMLVGEGALTFARKIGFPVVQDSETLISDRSRSVYLERKHEQKKDDDRNYKKHATNDENVSSKKENALVETHDTVGVVAMDTNGHIAVSCSTGGTSHKMSGRVGDSALVGSGSFANHWGGAVCTGHGESIMKVVLSREVVRCIETGDTPQDACLKSLSKMTDLVGEKGGAGVISMDKFGKVGVAFNTRQMSWASLIDGNMKYGIDPGEELDQLI